MLSTHCFYCTYIIIYKESLKNISRFFNYICWKLVNESSKLKKNSIHFKTLKILLYFQNKCLPRMIFWLALKNRWTSEIGQRIEATNCNHETKERKRERKKKSCEILCSKETIENFVVNAKPVDDVRPLNERSFTLE